MPKRTSSISSRSTETRSLRANGLNKTRENGSLSSVQSSGSDSSLSTDRVTCENLEDSNHRCSPIWKRKGQVNYTSIFHKFSLITDFYLMNVEIVFVYKKWLSVTCRTRKHSHTSKHLGNVNVIGSFVNFVVFVHIVSSSD